MKHVTCLAVGDDTVGKTCLCVSYMKNAFPKEYIPVAFDENWMIVMEDNESVSLHLLENDGPGDYDGLQDILYRQAEVFLVCFSVISLESYENVRMKWIPKLKHHCPNTPVILVGTKLDLRDDMQTLTSLSDMKQQPLTTQQGMELAKEIKAVNYLECSALTQEGLKEVIQEAVKAVRQPPRTTKRSSICVLV